MRLRAQGGIRKGSGRDCYRESTRCAEDRSKYHAAGHQQKPYKALSIKGLLPARMTLKRKYFKHSSPTSPKGMKTPETPLTQPLPVAKKHRTCA